MADETAQPDRPSGWGLPLGVGTGAGIGMVVGILLDMLAMGLIIGAAIGLVVGAVTTSATDTPAARRGRAIAAAIGIVSAGTAIILAIMSR